MLEFTSIEIGDIINRDGYLIYSYFPGENYIVSRREYEQIKTKIFDVLSKVTDEPEKNADFRLKIAKNNMRTKSFVGFCPLFMSCFLKKIFL